MLKNYFVQITTKMQENNYYILHDSSSDVKDKVKQLIYALLRDIKYHFTHLNEFIFFWSWQKTVAFLALYIALFFIHRHLAYTMSAQRIVWSTAIISTVLIWGIMGVDPFRPFMIFGVILLVIGIILCIV
ncbi:MAG: hypothetical protein K2H29_08585 [Oscillospiraceae bacterium]|nr:hypothetical protein [Oscillospiraceae bacterium]